MNVNTHPQQTHANCVRIPKTYGRHTGIDSTDGGSEQPSSKVSRCLCSLYPLDKHQTSPPSCSGGVTHGQTIADETFRYGSAHPLVDAVCSHADGKPFADSSREPMCG